MVSAALIVLLAAAAPLFAQGSETWWGLAPCALCLWQRWPYWVAAGLAALAIPMHRRWRGALLGLAGLAALVSAGLAVLHLGVEWGWWPSPLAGCQPPARGLGDPLLALPAAPTKPCDAPTFLIPGVPLSMAAMNLFYALGLGGLTLVLAREEQAT